MLSGFFQMAGGNEDPEDSMDGSDENDDHMDSTDQSDCDDLDLTMDGYFDDANEYCAVHENLKDDIRKAHATYPDAEEELGIPSVQIDETRSNLKYISAVVLTFTLKDISEHLLELWDLEDTPAIIMEMDNIHRGEFRCYGQLPTITVKKHSSEGHFIVGEQLKNFVLRLCRDSYPLRSPSPVSTIGSFFAMVYGAVKERLMRLSEYCVTCGEVLSSGGVLPSICDRDLCMYQYSELHLFDGLSVPRVSPQVLSLLLFAFANANLSHRRKDILTPAPPIKNMPELLAEAKSKQTVKKGEAGDTATNKMDPYGSDDLRGSTYWNTTVSNAVTQKFSAFNTTESATFSVLLENLPCPKEILASVSAYHQFRKDWPKMSDIVDWLVISNRSYLEMVPRPMTVDFLHTECQYCFVSDSPAKQAEFDKLVEQNGGKTRFFFHGSPLENWHSIIRSGLKNMSGTKYQLVGAAYGKGIYMSPFLDFAIGYASRMGGSFSRRVTPSGGVMTDRPIRSSCTTSECCDTERAEDLSCVALVEVVDCPEAYNEKTEEIFVVEKDQWCSIRMLLLYRSSDIDKLHTAIDKASLPRRDQKYASRASSRLTRLSSARAAFTAHAAAVLTPPSASSAAAAASGGGSLSLQQSQAPPQQTFGVRGYSSFAPSHQQSIPPTSQSLMSFMMNKFNNWAGGTVGGSGGTGAAGGAGSDPAASARPDQMDQMGIVNLAKTKKLERQLKRKEEAARRSVVAAAAAAGGGGVVLPDVSAAATLGSSSLSASSSSNVIVDLGKEEEEEEQPGTSGLQKESERQREERMKMALGDSQEGKVLAPGKSDDEDWLEMREARRLRKEQNKKNKKKGDAHTWKEIGKVEKESSKRKRSMFDSTPDVPKKTSSSPSNDKHTDLTEEDIKMLEMFADSDLGEDDVQVLNVNKGKERIKKKLDKKLEKMMKDESDDDIEIVEAKESRKTKNVKREPFSDIEDEEEDDDDDVIELMNNWEEEEKEEDAQEDSAGGSSSQAAAAAPATATHYVPLTSYIRKTVRNSYPPMAGPPPSSSSLPSSASFPPPGLPPSSLQHSHSVQSLQLVQQQSVAQMQQSLNSLSSMMMKPYVSSLPPTGSSTASTGPSSAAAAAAAVAAGTAGSAGLLQMMSGFFPSRRRRRGTSDGRGAIPGDLTTISDEQREQIYRVVRMFRNSGFEERVNRHMNREEEEKKEEEEGPSEGGSGDSTNSSDM